MDKRGELLVEAVVFVVLNIIFFSAMFAFVSMKENDAALYEEAYAKQTALLIDSAKPGTKISFDVSNLINRFPDTEVFIYDKRKSVGVSSKKDNIGYEHPFFADFVVECAKSSDNSCEIVGDRLNLEIKNG